MATDPDQAREVTYRCTCGKEARGGLDDSADYVGLVYAPPAGWVTVMARNGQIMFQCSPACGRDFLRR